jgi:hypothetical protein
MVMGMLKHECYVMLLGPIVLYYLPIIAGVYWG